MVNNRKKEDDRRKEVESAPRVNQTTDLCAGPVHQHALGRDAQVLAHAESQQVACTGRAGQSTGRAKVSGLSVHGVWKEFGPKGRASLSWFN